MITVTFYEVVNLFVLSAIAFSTTGLLFLTAFQEYRYHKAKKGMTNALFSFIPQAEAPVEPQKVHSKAGNYQ